MSRPHAFVLGAPRSGTTLLRVMLAGHPELFSPPEMVLAPFSTMAERTELLEQRYWEKGGLRRALMELDGLDVDAAKELVASWVDRTVPEVYSLLAAKAEGRMIVDKCPHLSVSDGLMERVEAWATDARYVWILRNPGSVTRSLQNMPMAEVILSGYAGTAGDVWHLANQRIQRFLATVPDARWCIVRYEDLVRDPEPAMRRALQTLGVPWDAAVTRPYEGERMRTGPKGARAIGDPNMAGRGRIQPELAKKWLDSYDHRTASAKTKALALELGYDLEAIPLPRITAVSAAMQSLFQAAMQLERGIDMPQELDGLEGRRFLMRMLSASADTFLEYNDPDRPAFHHSEGPTRKMFADCPDTDYLRAPIRMGPGRAYRIRGRVPAGTTYVGVLYYGRGGRIGSRLTDADLRLDADGRFELYLSTEAQPGHTLLADGDETAIMVRQYYNDRQAQPAIELSIDYLGAPATELDPTTMAKQVQRSQRMLQAIFERTVGAFKMISSMALNQFIQIPGEALFPTPDNTYQVAWYRFGYNQVMFIRGKLPTSRYFSITLYNAWMESFDYTRHTISLNREHIQADAEGNFELCLAHSDPGHPNWLHTTGHHAGYVLARNLLLEGDPPKLTIQVMYEGEWAALRDQRSGPNAGAGHSN